ncbi:MAG: DUF3786 domain-containing protein [Anaerolineales bacterium]|jgi:hypothetical protein
MSGLTGQAGGDQLPPNEKIERAHRSWEEAMIRRIDELRASLRERNLPQLANLVGAKLDDHSLHFRYWLKPIAVHWPVVEASNADDGEPLSTFDQAMLMYYLATADGAPMADHWIGFRELPDGAFYNQAFESYSGRPIADHFGEHPNQLKAAAETLSGTRLPSLAPQAYSFLPLPRIRIAIALWPGDEDFPARASVLFDAAASHFMTTDGLALLGAGLARRLIRSRST